MPLSVTTTAFDEGEHIPADHTCDGADRAPTLNIKGIPSEAATVALILHDPDAPDGNFVHWLVWNVPTEGQQEIAFGPDLPSEAHEGRNDFGHVRYGGPCPPRDHPPHRYEFDVFALDTKLDLDAGADEASLRKVMDGHVLDEGRLTGVYTRPRA